MADSRVKNVTVPGTAEWWRQRRAREARRRPRAEGLSMARITAAALAILDQEGLEALTMRRLADDLGAGVASLYRHVATRDELLVEIIDRVLGEIRAGDEARTWRETTWWLAHEVRRVLALHPALLQLVPTVRLLGPNAERVREMALRHLLAGGFTPEDAAQVYGIVAGWILGYSVLSMRPGPPGDGRSQPTDGAVTADGLFELGLRALLDGVEARYRPRRAGPA